MMLLKQEVLTHCQWALCCCMQKTHFYCSTGGKSRDKGVLTPSSPCVWPKHVSPCTGVCAAPEKNLCQWWVGAVYCSRWEKEGAMSALWQSQGKAGSWEYGVGGEAGNHLNTESGVFRSLPVFWGTVTGASNLSAGHWLEEVSSSNQDILLSINWIRLNNCEFLKAKGRDLFGLICVNTVVVILPQSKQVICQNSVYNLECCFLAGADELWDHK